MKNIQAFAELTRAQSGIDAVLNVEPAAQGAVNAGELVNLLLNDGTTGPPMMARKGRGPAQDRQLRQDAVRPGGLLSASHLVGGARGVPAEESESHGRADDRQCASDRRS